MGWKFRQKKRFGSSRVPRESGVYEGLGKTRYSAGIVDRTQPFDYATQQEQVVVLPPQSSQWNVFRGLGRLSD